MKILFGTIVLLAAMLVPAPALAAIVYVNATQDAAGNKFEPGRYPFNTYLLWVRGTPFYTQSRFGVLFDELSAIPVSADLVQRVWLQLYQFGGLGQGRGRITVAPAAESWTAEDFPDRGLVVSPDARAAAATVDAPNVGRWISFDVTSTVKGWLRDPEANHGFSVSGQPISVTSGLYEAEYIIVFESTDSRWPEGSEQFGNDFPPGHPPRLKVQYRDVMQAERPRIDTTSPPTPTVTVKKQVKGITSKPSWSESLTNFFSSFLP